MNRMGSWNICGQVCVHRHARAFGLVSWLHPFIRGSLPHINGYVPGFHLWSATSHGQVFLGWIYVYVYVYVYMYMYMYMYMYVYIYIYLYYNVLHMFCGCMLFVHDYIAVQNAQVVSLDNVGLLESWSVLANHPQETTLLPVDTSCLGLHGRRPREIFFNNTVTIHAQKCTYVSSCLHVYIYICIYMYINVY